MEKKKSLGKTLQSLVLVASLILLPLGSWYYLQSGYTYHKQALAELKDYGELPAFELRDQNGQSFTKDSLLGSIAISAFYNSDDPQTDDLFGFIRRLHEQFDDRHGVLFLLHDLKATDTPDELKSLANRYEIKDDKQILLLTAQADRMQALLDKGYQVPDLENGRNTEGKYGTRAASSSDFRQYPYLVITDTKAGVRNYYAYGDIASQKRLIEHIALTMPRKKSNPRMNPQKENL
ncbi:MAG: hypothetical protein AAF990_12640 [Bacteroidota bacterium]